MTAIPESQTKRLSSEACSVLSLAWLIVTAEERSGDQYVLYVMR